MTKLPDWYFVSLINTEFISLYVDNFINNTSHFQINDARQLPVIIPDNETYNQIKRIASDSISTKKELLSSTHNTVQAEEMMSGLQKELDQIIINLYKI